MSKDMSKVKNDDQSKFNVYDFKLDCEGETRTITTSKGVATTTIPFVPVHGNIVVRGIFEESESMLVAANMDKIRQSGNDNEKVVVAVSGDVNDIEVGDVVSMPYNPGIQELDLPDNTRSIRKTIKYVKNPNRKVGLDKQFRKIKMVEYVTAPAIAIKGIFK